MVMEGSTLLKGFWHETKTNCFMARKKLHYNITYLIIIWVLVANPIISKVDISKNFIKLILYFLFHIRGVLNFGSKIFSKVTSISSCLFLCVFFWSVLDHFLPIESESHQKQYRSCNWRFSYCKGPFNFWPCRRISSVTSPTECRLQIPCNSPLATNYKFRNCLTNPNMQVIPLTLSYLGNFIFIPGNLKITRNYT